MRDGLAYLHCQSLQVAQPVADIGQEFVARTPVQHERRFEFRCVYAEGVFVEFGAAGLAGHGLYFRYFEEDFLYHPSHAVGLFERYARHRGDADGQRTFVEGRQEAAAEGAENDGGADEEGDHSRKHRLAVTECPGECLAVDALEEPRDGRFLLAPFQGTFRSQHVARHDRCQRHGYQQRGQQRDDEGDAERFEHASLHSAEEEERHEGDDGDESGVHDGDADFARGVVNHLQAFLPFGFGTGIVFPQPFVDILHVDDGVVYERADGDGHAAEAHGVDGMPRKAHDDDGDEQRQGHGRERDERHAAVHQEYQQHEDDEEGSLDEGVFDVVYRAVDEARLPEDIGRYLHVVRKARTELGDGRIECFGEVDGAGVGLFGDGYQHGRFAPYGGYSQLRRFGSRLYFGDVAEGYRFALG